MAAKKIKAASVRKRVVRVVKAPPKPDAEEIARRARALLQDCQDAEENDNERVYVQRRDVYLYDVTLVLEAIGVT